MTENPRQTWNPAQNLTTGLNLRYGKPLLNAFGGKLLTARDFSELRRLEAFLQQFHSRIPRGIVPSG
jgi:hypothetical protein